MNKFFAKWGALVMLFVMMAFMGAVLVTATIIPAHNAERLEELHKLLEARTQRFDALQQSEATQMVKMQAIQATLDERKALFDSIAQRLQVMEQAQAEHQKRVDS